MNPKNDKETGTSERTFVIERIFDAPRELVWQVWTAPEHVAHWWGPKDWTLPVCTMDFRPGGVWHYCMCGPGGEESWGKAIYHEIVEPERIVFTDAFADAEGNINESMPSMLTTVFFVEHEGKTKLISQTQFASDAELEKVLAMGMAEGSAQMWDRLEAYLSQL
ncbi:MAG: SRPBCC domain-containing protein [Chloroflexota bacterium]